ncbi:MAG: ATP-binding protein [Candidatus Paceibacterota bacterium]
MNNETKTLEMRFDGTVTDRREFLERIRASVTGLTGEIMTLDALINEIAKNIFDHAHGMGSLVIELKNGAFEFEIKDNGEETHDFESCSNHSRLAGNGVNFGTGLRIIRDLAQSLGVDLQIDTSKGFSYSGTYVPQNYVD